MSNGSSSKVEGGRRERIIIVSIMAGCDQFVSGFTKILATVLKSNMLKLRDI